ncbi:hypothetical protein [Caldithrix abyssi]|nr:hypothetical protein [Caldithrix abyssi]APF20389.1 hypothetical protein Cabys_3643 [Caldithrix abyssi DSM 13497]
MRYTRFYKDLANADVPSEEHDDLILCREEIEDFMELFPDELTDEQKKAIQKADRWILEHADQVIPQIRGFTNKPSAKYWWEHPSTLSQKAAQLMNDE